MVRHKVFVSYHHDDQAEVDRFVNTFDANRDIFIARALGTEMDPTIINSTNPDYVMQRIRQLYLADSTVTVVIIGRCTWARRFVDWEIQSSLRRGDTVTPNGLLGIKLPSYVSHGCPERLNKNLRQGQQTECYARWIEYPSGAQELRVYLEDAFEARTARANLIVNPRERMVRNRPCL